MSLQNGVLGAFGLDFGGLGPPFWRVRASFSKALDVILGITNAKNAQKPAKTKARSQGGQTAKGWVGGGDPPGGFQSAAHRRCGNGVLNPNYIVFSQSSRLITKGQAPDGKPKFSVRLLDPSLFLSPGAWGPPPTLRQEAEKWDFVAFFFDFLLFQVAI